MALNFPDSPSTNQTYIAAGRTWVYNGSRWALVTAGAVDITPADGSVTAAKIADGTIVAAEIASSAITTDKIASDAVTTAKIADDALTTAKILDANVTTAKIASDAVTTAKILDANVTTAKVAANAITQAKLASNLTAVTVTTTATRDTDIPSPFTGQLAILTDTSKVQLYNGTAWVNISLAPPETPTSLSATALSTTSVSIAFTAGGANGSPITNYKYALSTDSGSTYGSFTALSPAEITSPITISGLTAATTYFIKLKAVNDMGDSVASAAVSIGTLSTPDAPTSLSATPSSATSVSVAFTPGAQGGSAISNYQYALSTDSGSTYGSFTALATPDATSPITISGLSEGTAYYVKLKGVNDDGAGGESSAVSFTIPTLSVDYLVVAGGGGSGNSFGGGGGAGGLRCTVDATGGGGVLESALSLTSSTNYTVTVGAGGSGSTTSQTQGNSSVFSSVSTVGGGKGGDGYNPGAGSGGSGGGVGSNGGSGGTGTANEGFDGGTGSGNYGNGAGGGGAGAVGTNALGSPYAGTAGGNGIETSISGVSTYYGGGGGGGGQVTPVAQGGLGGGGNGGENNPLTAATAGTANTGGGGGGGPTSGLVGGSGGSGVVILRYDSTFTITIGAGLTGTTATDGSHEVTTITAGTGNVSWA